MTSHRWLIAACVLLAASGARAAPTTRYQVDLRGDLVLLGNTVGQSCRPTAQRPLVGTIGMCGTMPGAGPIDVLWRADHPAEGQALADAGITPELARTTAVLALPPGAVVAYARLYWAAGRARGSGAGMAVLLERPGQFMQTITADAGSTLPDDGPGMFYQSTADVTSILQDLGPGPLRISRIDAVSPVDLDRLNFAAWSLVVIYRRAADPPRTLSIIDGLERVDNRASLQVALQNFLPAPSGFDARLGVIAYQGDDTISGDRLRVNGKDLANDQNPANNFFNGTRSLLGQAVTTAGDLPQASGRPGSLSGVDLDIVDLTPLIKPEETQALVAALTTEDIYYWGAFAGAVATLKPVLADSEMTWRNRSNPGGAVRPGDVVELTVAVRNTGSDTATGAVLQAALPSFTSYVPGSLRTTGGPGAGARSDQAGDDPGEYDAASRTVRLRLGTGADATRGGQFALGGAPLLVQYRVTVEPGARDQILHHQAVITASGLRAEQQKIPPATWRTGTSQLPNRPVAIPVLECRENSDCPPTAPVCDRMGAPRCTNACRSSMDCAGAPTGSVCLPSMTCGCQQDTDCIGHRCDPRNGTCVLQEADLALSVRLIPDPPSLLLPVTHVISVANLGPGAAFAATVAYHLPEGATLREVVPGEAWSCDTKERLVTCRRGRALAPEIDEAPPIRIVIDPPAGATVLEVSATVRDPGSIDPRPENNSVTTTVDLSPEAIQLAGGGFSCAAGAGTPAAARLPGLLALLGLLLALGLGRRRP